MNILISHNWLKEYLHTEASPEQIQTNLSLCGPSVEKIISTTTPAGQKDFIYDIEVTTNRVDMMNIKGLAREAAVILQQFQLDAQFNDHHQNILQAQKAAAQITPAATTPLPEIKVKTRDCQRIFCGVLKVEPASQLQTPDWMKSRLEQCGHQSHGLLVDITNYVTHELGYPCHAFDYDKIVKLGNTINVSEAEAEQKFTTLDNQDHLTQGGEIIFTNDQNVIIDLPAVMGTTNTAVDHHTTRILFWLENINPQKVRFTSMTHHLRTTAATLNEKNIDLHLMPEVFYRGLALYQELAHAQLLTPVYDYFPDSQQKLPTITVPWNKFTQYLGIELPREQIVKILTDLEIEIKTDPHQLTAQPPTFRTDLSLPVDIIEEVARIYGYHNIPTSLDFTTTALPRQKEFNFVFEDQLKNYLSNINYQEIYQYSAVNQELALQSGYSLTEHLQFINPLSQDHVYLRRHLLPSLTEIYQQNQANYQGKNKPQLNLFELANVYHPQVDVDQIQSLKLGLLSNQSYRQVRADLENLLSLFYINNLSIQEIFSTNSKTTQADTADTAHLPQLPHQTQSALLTLTPPDSQKKPSIVIGQLYVFKPQAETLIGIQLDLTALLPFVKKYPLYQPLNPAPITTEDLTFTIETATPQIGDLITQIKNVSSLIINIDLKEIYQNRYTLTLAYQSQKGVALTSAEVSALRHQIVAQAEKNKHVKLVGKLE